jgi:hypothetical protein
MRAKSPGAIRLRCFRAGAVRTTNQGFFSSEFIEGDAIASLECFSAATNGPQFSGRRRFLWDFANQEIPLQGLGCKVGRVPILFSGWSVHAPDHCSRKFNRVLLLGHCSLSLSPRKNMSRYVTSWCSIERRYFKSFLKTTPPFITNLTRSISVMSVSGSPETATMSANLPFSTYPTSFPKS